VFYLTLAEPGPTLSPAGPYIRARLPDPVYVGLAVCAHDDKVLETARFSQVGLQMHNAPANQKPVLHSTIEIVPISSKDRQAVYHTLDHLEAPNWTRDGQFLLFNSNGRIFRLPVKGGKPVEIDTGFANRCNNDHGLSPDGMRLAISDQSQGGKSLIYIVSVSGGVPKPITTLAPSYWHGWSPDGSTLSYCGERNGEFDVYTISVEGGEEKRLTTAKGLDDGPEYTPDGKFIYFNSDRTGTMQIWRMKPDGTDQQQVTSDDFNNWFAHPSPDGKWLVFLSYEKNVSGHPANKPVRLRLMPLGGGPIQDLARLFGGQGTINVPSWSPDSRQVAFVSYELIQP
jgi:dipeptidyl aminopeptidase/acylaminoacyl peptidase